MFLSVQKNSPTVGLTRCVMSSLSCFPLRRPFTETDVFRLAFLYKPPQCCCCDCCLRKRHRDRTVHQSALLSCLAPFSLAYLGPQHSQTSSCSSHLTPIAQLIRSLVAAGANPNLPNAQGISAVSFAAQQGNSRCLAALLSSGGSPHLLVKNSLPTPLQWAIIGLNPTCLALLLAAGANPEDRHASSAHAPLVQERLSKKYRPGTLGARMLQVLDVAKAYDAHSWQWAKEKEKDGKGEKTEEPANPNSGGAVAKPMKPFAGTRWFTPRRGVFVPAVLRSVEKGWFPLCSSLGIVLDMRYDWSLFGCTAVPLFER